MTYRGYKMIGQAKIVRANLLEKISDLPEAKLQEVLDFVDFLRSREPEVEDPILNVAGCLSGTPLSGSEIEEELYGRVPA
jgi:hypothetical protein